MKTVVFAVLLTAAAAIFANAEEMSHQVLANRSFLSTGNTSAHAVDSAALRSSEAATPDVGMTPFDCHRDAGSEPYTVLYGVNNAGAVVGACDLKAGQEGFLYANGVFTFLEGMQIAAGINNLGQIVGSNNGDGVLYSNGTYTSINYPGADVTVLNAINDQGTIVGVYQVGSAQHGFIYSNGTYTSWDYPGAASTYLSGINNAGQLVGSFCAALCQISHGFLVTGSNYTLIDYPGAQGTGVNGINNNGVLVGGYNNETAFIYDNGTYTSFDYNNSADTAFQSINDLGEFVGYWTRPPSTWYGLRGNWPQR